MSLLNSRGRSSDQKSKTDSLVSPPMTISQITQYPNNFHYWNGDEYTGQFAILKDKQKIMMQGTGTYKTSDGQTYEGIWDNDCLNEECKITFPDKSIFSGNLDEMVIQGSGKYSFKENLEIEGQFINNRLVGEVDLKDPNGRIWSGKVEKDVAFVDFHPLHPFWQSVLNLSSKAFQQFYGEAEEENVWEGFYYV